MMEGLLWSNSLTKKLWSPEWHRRHGQRQLWLCVSKARLPLKAHYFLLFPFFLPIYFISTLLGLAVFFQKTLPPCACGWQQRSVMISDRMCLFFLASYSISWCVHGMHTSIHGHTATHKKHWTDSISHNVYIKFPMVSFLCCLCLWLCLPLHSLSFFLSPSPLHSFCRWLAVGSIILRSFSSSYIISLLSPRHLYAQIEYWSVRLPRGLMSFSARSDFPLFCSAPPGALNKHSVLPPVLREREKRRKESQTDREIEI